MAKIYYFILTKSIGLYLNLLRLFAPEKAVQLAYRFFSEPRTGRLNPKQLPEILKSASFETITIGEVQFQVYHWEGKEKTILLVHGWESNASRWENLLPYLQKTGHTILALDAPAHGLSSGKEFTIPRYAKCIDVVVQKYQPQYLIGHSIGGKTCLYYHYHYPNNTVEKIVSLGAPSDFKILLHNFGNILSLHHRLVQDLEARYIAMYKQQLEDFSAKKFVAQFSVKGLVVHDREDDVVSIQEGVKIAEAWKTAQFIETKGLGHSMHDDQLYQNISRFLFET